MPNEESEDSNYIPVDDSFNNDGLVSIRGLYDPYQTDQLGFMPHLQLDQDLQVLMMGQENPNYVTDNLSTNFQSKNKYLMEERISTGSRQKNETFFRPSTKWTGK
jgi:hypothetical protein